jgi:hypothetical protein
MADANSTHREGGKPDSAREQNKPAPGSTPAPEDQADVPGHNETLSESGKPASDLHGSLHGNWAKTSEDDPQS